MSKNQLYFACLDKRLLLPPPKRKLRKISLEKIPHLQKVIPKHNCLYTNFVQHPFFDSLLSSKSQHHMFEQMTKDVHIRSSPAAPCHVKLTWPYHDCVNLVCWGTFITFK